MPEPEVDNPTKYENADGSFEGSPISGKVGKIDFPGTPFNEHENYRPSKKVIIVTTDKMVWNNKAYSFDYNYLYQATQFLNEESRKSPVILQMPHLRVNPWLSFDGTHQVIFTLQSIAQANACQKQPQIVELNERQFFNPDLSNYEICKKLLSSKWS